MTMYAAQHLRAMRYWSSPRAPTKPEPTSPPGIAPLSNANREQAEAARLQTDQSTCIFARLNRGHYGIHYLDFGGINRRLARWPGYERRRLRRTSRHLARNRRRPHRRLGLWPSGYLAWRRS